MNVDFSLEDLPCLASMLGWHSKSNKDRFINKVLNSQSSLLLDY